MKVEQELRDFVQAVADASPEPPLIDPSRHGQRRPAPIVALVGGFAAVLLIVGAAAGWMLANVGDDATTVATSSLPATGEAAPTKQEILADGVVTEAEYRAAVQGVVACMDARGFETLVEYDSSGIAGFNSYGDGVADFFDACFEGQLGSVALAWASQNASSEDDIAFYNDVLDCVEAETGESYGDVEAAGDTRATDAAIAAAPVIYDTCLDKTFAKARLNSLVDMAERVDPPPDMSMTSSTIDQMPNEGTQEPLEPVLMGTVKFNSAAPGAGSLTVTIVMNAPWDPESEIETAGGSALLTSVSGVGEALVDEQSSGTSIAFPLPDAVIVTVLGRDLPIGLLEAFAAQIRADLVGVPH